MDLRHSKAHPALHEMVRAMHEVVVASNYRQVRHCPRSEMISVGPAWACSGVWYCEAAMFLDLLLSSQRQISDDDQSRRCAAQTTLVEAAPALFIVVIICLWLAAGC